MKGGVGSKTMQTAIVTVGNLTYLESEMLLLILWWRSQHCSICILGVFFVFFFRAGNCCLVSGGLGIVVRSVVWSLSRTLYLLYNMQLWGIWGWEIQGALYSDMHWCFISQVNVMMANQLGYSLNLHQPPLLSHFYRDKKKDLCREDVNVGQIWAWSGHTLQLLAKCQFWGKIFYVCRY